MIFSTSFQPKKILVIKLRKLGDVLGTTPSVRQIYKLYPSAEITFLSEPLGAQVYEFSPYIYKVWVLNRNPSVLEYVKMIASVRRNKFDVIIDLYHHNKTALMAMFSGAKYRLGFTHENEKVRSYNYTVSLTPHEKAEVNRTHHQLKLTSLIGTNYEDDRIEFELNNRTKEFGSQFAQNNNVDSNTIAFCAQSEREEAQVPTGIWVKIGNYLLNKGHKLLFIYGPGEREKAESVYSLLEKKKSCIIDYEVPKVAETRAILEYCKMFVGNDGGNKHLAVSAGIPTIGLFYGDSPKVWTPDSPRHRFIQTKENKNPFDDFVRLYNAWDEHKGALLIEQ